MSEAITVPVRVHTTQLRPEDSEVETVEPGVDQELSSSPAAAPRPADAELAEQNRQLQLKVHELLGDIERLQRQAEQQQQRAQRDGEDLAVRVVAPALAALDEAWRQVSHRDDQVARGLALARQGLESALSQAGYQRIPDEGQRFDPRCHEAVVCQPSPGESPGQVLQCLSPGFVRDDVVVVPARVVVSSDPPADDSGE